VRDMRLHIKVIDGIQRNMFQESHAESIKSIDLLTVAVNLSSINGSNHVGVVMSFKDINKMACQLRVCVRMASEGKGVSIFFKSGNDSMHFTFWNILIFQ
jgi:hypothetical protein